MSSGVGLVLLALACGAITIAFEKYGVNVTVVAWTLMGIGAGGLVLRLLQPVTRWSLFHLMPRGGHNTAPFQS